MQLSLCYFQSCMLMYLQLVRNTFSLPVCPRQYKMSVSKYLKLTKPSVPPYPASLPHLCILGNSIHCSGGVVVKGGCIKGELVP